MENPWAANEATAVCAESVGEGSPFAACVAVVTARVSNLPVGILKDGPPSCMYITQKHSNIVRIDPLFRAPLQICENLSNFMEVDIHRPSDTQ